MFCRSRVFYSKGLTNISVGEIITHIRRLCHVLHAIVCDRRVNPFNQPNDTSASDGTTAPSVDDGPAFSVRFLGSQQVLTDRGIFTA